jgi:hypothetical protein
MRSLWALVAGGVVLAVVTILRSRRVQRKPSTDDLGTISDQWRAEASRSSDY